MASLRSLISSSLVLFVLLGSLVGDVRAERIDWDLPEILLPTSEEQNSGDAGSSEVGTRWAVLVAGSNGYGNYRHQVARVYGSSCMII